LFYTCQKVIKSRTAPHLIKHDFLYSGLIKSPKGVVMPIEKDVLNLNDKYLIKSSNHAILGTKETVSIKIEKFEDIL